MSWDIERAKIWVERRAHPTFQFTCLFEHFETLQLTHLGFLLQQISYLLLLFLEFSQLFLVLDWDPKQWLIVLTRHTSIPHALQHTCIWYLAVRSVTSQVFKPKLKEWIWESSSNQHARSLPSGEYLGTNPWSSIWTRSNWAVSWFK